MMTYLTLVITLPLLAALIAALLRGKLCRTLLLTGSIIHLALCVYCFNFNIDGRWIGLTAKSEAILLLLTSLLFGFFHRNVFCLVFRWAYNRP